MKANIIQIGNSQGLRIPKKLLEETGISGEVELQTTPEGILIKNIRKPRGNWDVLFKKFAEMDEEMPPTAVISTEFEKKGWQW
jgi:antitoxin MazE